MSELIVTTPSAPYFGEIWDTSTPSPEDLALLASPAPQMDFRPYSGSALPQAADGILIAPVLLPGAGGDWGDCLWTCATGLPASALGGAGVPMAGSGMIPKSWVGMRRGLGGASRFTTPGSIIAHRYPSVGAWRVPTWLPNTTPTGILRTRGTKVLLRFIGRWIPGIGWALLATDLVVIDQCVAQCNNKPSLLRTLCEELTPFCIKPAY